MQPITGTKDQRIAALRNDKADIYTINYENLPWLVEHLGEAWPFDTVTADEASKLRSFRLLQGGKRAQALASVAHTKVRRWINLSGTIAPNGLSNLWAPMWFIDRGQRLGRSYDSFESRWFGYKRAGDAVNAHKTRISRIAFPHAFGEITSLMRDVTLALNPKDWFRSRIRSSCRCTSICRPRHARSTVRWSVTCSRTSAGTTSKPSRRRARC